MSEVSGAYPDADLEVKARWQRLAVLEMRTAELVKRDHVVPREEVESVQMSANGWGVIVNPRGAVALVRRQEEDKKPLAFIAPEGTVDFRTLCVKLVEASQKNAAKGGAAFAGGFRIRGDNDVAFARIYDLAIWNAVITAATQRLEAPVRAEFASVSRQFPMQIEAVKAVAK